MWYMLSKTLAEKAAWEFGKQKGIDMVSINPSCVIGPMLQPTLKTSCAQVLSLVGAETCGNAAYGWVHVKDVVDAHVLAYETPEAGGRYYVVERCANRLELAGILAQLYPHMKFPARYANSHNLAMVLIVLSLPMEMAGVEMERHLLRVSG